MIRYSKNVSLKDYLNSKKETVEQALETFCDSKPENIPCRLWESMTYSLMAGGKRLRPVLCLEAASLYTEDIEPVIPFALSLEMIHTASLIHDDLPCMDNDTLRRGKPTNHVKFGEALALMAGTSLLIAAFEYPLRHAGAFPDRVRLTQALSVLMDAAGPSGIHGGQTLDTDPLSRSDSPDFVWKIAEQKTACLIQASVLTGAIAAGASEKELDILSDYSRHLGLAFQIVDDILDITSNASELGKTPGKDKEQGKVTFPATFGYERSIFLAENESHKAFDEAVKLGEKGLFFQDLAVYLESRTK
jgi:geranylgeranyl diphosphate synthase type II